MVGGPRDYTVGVERKLYRVARGTCYHPECGRPIMIDVDGLPVCDVEIAHIRGAEAGSARFDEAMTDAARAAFANLILLCSAHQKLVDRVAADDYPLDVLEAWKAANEDDDLAALAGATLNQETLEAVLEEIVGRLRPRREVAVELECGLIVPTGGVMTSPGLAVLEKTVAANPITDFSRVRSRRGFSMCLGDRRLRSRPRSSQTIPSVRASGRASIAWRCSSQAHSDSMVD